MSAYITISKTFRFEASHVLPKHPGKCSRLHGHSWVLSVSVQGDVDPSTGFVMDYADLSKIVNEKVVDVLDHQHLGCGNLVRSLGMGYADQTFAAALGPDFYPTSENLVKWIVKQIFPCFNQEPCRLVQVTLDETCTSRATWSLK